MQNDDDLRARFQKLADRVESVTPPFHPVGVSDGLGAARRATMVFAAASRGRRRFRSRSGVLILGIGLVWGTSTGYASARVQSERERHEIAATAGRVTTQLATLRRELTRTRSGLVELAAKQGISARASLLAAEAEVDSMTANVARIEQNVNVTGGRHRDLRGRHSRYCARCRCERRLRLSAADQSHRRVGSHRCRRAFR